MKRIAYAYNGAYNGVTRALAPAKRLSRHLRNGWMGAGTVAGLAVAAVAALAHATGHGPIWGGPPWG